MQNDRDTAFTRTTGEVPPAGGTADDRFDGIGTDRPTGFNPVDDGAAGGIGSRAREVASDVRHQATDRIQDRAEAQKHRAVDSLGSVAQSLRTASAQLPDQDGVSRYMERAASQVDHLANFLNNKEMAELFDDVESFARRQPAMFVGGAFAVGMLGARFLKSSRRNIADDRFRDSWSTEDLTSRVDDPGRDSISRPATPGYVPPEERSGTGFDTPGF